MPPKIRVIALDIYGTVLCSDDPENAMPSRTGFAEFIWRAKNLGLKIVTASDADLTNLKLDLEATFRGRVNFGLEIFNGFYYLPMAPKGYGDILADFDISAEELLIIGNNYDKDLAGAPPFSSRVLVPSYEELHDKFDFSKLVIP